MILYYFDIYNKR